MRGYVFGACGIAGVIAIALTACGRASASQLVPYPNAVEVHFANRSVGWALASLQDNVSRPARVEVIRTTDGGQSWNTVLPQAPQPAATVGEPRPVVMNVAPEASLEGAAFLNATDAWVLARPSVPSVGGRWLVEHSVNGGQTWSPEVIPVPVASPSIYFSDSAHGWLLDAHSRAILATTDGGASWETVGTAPPGLFGPAQISFATAQVGLISDPPKLYQTDTSGTAWHQLALPDVPGTAGLRGSFGVPTVSPNGDLTVPAVFLPPPHPAQSVQSPAQGPQPCVPKPPPPPTVPSPLHSCGSKGCLVFLTMTGGQRRWTVEQLLPNTPQHISFYNAKGGYMIYGTSLLRTIDGGAHWSGVAAQWPLGGELDFASAISGMQLQFITPELGWAVAANACAATISHLMHTTDGGVHWSIVSRFRAAAGAFGGR